MIQNHKNRMQGSRVTSKEEFSWRKQRPIWNVYAIKHSVSIDILPIFVIFDCYVKNHFLFTKQTKQKKKC